MGAIFCSYYVNNRIARLRDAIQNSQISQIKTELKEYIDETKRPDTPIKTRNLSTSQSNHHEGGIIDFSIDAEGNTPLILSIESRQLSSFNYLLNELNADPNKPNEFTLYSPLHICSLAVPLLQLEKSS